MSKSHLQARVPMRENWWPRCHGLCTYLGASLAARTSQENSTSQVKVFKRQDFLLCRMFSLNLSLNSCCVSPGSSQHLASVRLILGVLDPSLPCSLLCWFATWSIPGGPVGLHHKLPSGIHLLCGSPSAPTARGWVLSGGCRRRGGCESGLLGSAPTDKSMEERKNIQSPRLSSVC